MDGCPVWTVHTSRPIQAPTQSKSDSGVSNREQTHEGYTSVECSMSEGIKQQEGHCHIGYRHVSEYATRPPKH
eukprot:365683-Chlamydomonas_euryale.AAC.5